MQNPTTYIDACNNFDKIYEEALLTRKPFVVTREGVESVAVIAAELNSIIETAYFKTYAKPPFKRGVGGIFKVYNA